MHLSYFDNVVVKFMVNGRTDAWKTDVDLLKLIDKTIIVYSNTPIGVNGYLIFSSVTQHDCKQGWDKYSLYSQQCIV